MKRLTNKTSYLTRGKADTYFVTLERIHNDRNGNPRFEAVLIPFANYSHVVSSPVYRFTGHSLGEEREAEWIVERYEEGFNK